MKENHYLLLFCDGHNSFNTDTFLKRWKWGVSWSILGKATDLGTQNLIYEIYKDKSAPESNHIPSRYLANQQLPTTDQLHAYQYIYLLFTSCWVLTTNQSPANQQLLTTNQSPKNQQLLTTNQSPANQQLLTIDHSCAERWLQTSYPPTNSSWLWLVACLLTVMFTVIAALLRMTISAELKQMLVSLLNWNKCWFHCWTETNVGFNAELKQILVSLHKRHG